MSSNLLLMFCALLWGTATFLQRLSADHMNPIIMQVIIALGFVLFAPIAIHMGGGWHNIKWSGLSICLTLAATVLSIIGNITCYTVLRGSNNTGSLAMLICLYPVWTLVLSVLFLHEAFTMPKIIGIIAMVLGTIFLSWG